MERRKVGRRTLLAGVGGAVAGSLLPGKAFASGSLNPPGGPVTYQGRSMASISAKIAASGTKGNPLINVLSLPAGSDCMHEIVDSGSYCMDGNLIALPGMHGLRISASFVDLTLCGFSIICAADPGGTPTASGIVCTGSVVTVSDGNVNGGLTGVDFALASNSVLWDLTVSGASGDGFRYGHHIQGYDNDAYQCGGAGHRCLGTHTYVEHCGSSICAIGFKGDTAPNIFMRNTATACPVPFDLGNCSFGPIVMVAPGNISSNPDSRHPEANYGMV